MMRIGDYMTRQPWSVQEDDSIGVARQMMAQREIHHLPVLDGKELVGVLTDRDLVAASQRVGVTVEQVMTATALRVDIDTPLDDVLERMIDRRSDAVLITADGDVAGIFTANDAVRVLRDVLHHRS
ncbi:MAG: hypothetical protein JWP01_1465 [Myxococcales bacterium]|nr:hypothetical protein [Myxococcales bacterium]